MTGTFQVTCHKPDNADKDRRMQGLGGPSGWYRDIDTLINNIENENEKYWTVAPTGESVWVVVRQRPNGRKYLKTEPDGVEPNNLLALPHCP
ncbi:conserved hypothetical protein [Mesorhizobium metallidurans STM 2683]|uniref:DUF3892 domain-containing protein n=1 Tax=Mesorhizobium metallidurans STM 2683 TaxID=1297569 RepID=M5EXJ5_9HYPH|nr:DUF3892 domain-containing protein [Mesorhizobium metallidurans]CCV04321.1 conserved hypothetical protein [Mesorhizobium metallidurans STM 2683]